MLTIWFLFFSTVGKVMMMMVMVVMLLSSSVAMFRGNYVHLQCP